MKNSTSVILFVLLITACSGTDQGIEFNKGSVAPGSAVTRKGVTLKLLGNPVKLGQPFPDIELTDAVHSNRITLADFKGKVVLLSIVPSLNTRVCEAQTHYLGRQGDVLPPEVVRITVSRDSLDIMSRFSLETGMKNVYFLSDRGINRFGPSTGLEVSGADILARSVIILDKQGIVRYIQVVPELTTLPDMKRAFRIARRWARGT